MSGSGTSSPGGAATVTTLNKVTITQPAASATLTIANTKTLTVSADTTLAGNPILKASPVLIHSSYITSIGTLTAETFFIGESTGVIGFIPQVACHATRFQLSLKVGTVVGSAAMVIKAYKNAASGTAMFTLTSATLSTSGTLTIQGAVTSGQDAFNGTSDFFTMSLNQSGGTSITASALNFAFWGTID